MLWKTYKIFGKIPVILGFYSSKSKKAFVVLWGQRALVPQSQVKNLPKDIQDGKTNTLKSFPSIQMTYLIHNNRSVGVRLKDTETDQEATFYFPTWLASK